MTGICKHGKAVSHTGQLLLPLLQEQPQQQQHGHRPKDSGPCSYGLGGGSRALKKGLEVDSARIPLILPGFLLSVQPRLLTKFRKPHMCTDKPTELTGVPICDPVVGLSLSPPGGGSVLCLGEYLHPAPFSTSCPRLGRLDLPVHSLCTPCYWLI